MAMSESLSPLDSLASALGFGSGWGAKALARALSQPAAGAAAKAAAGAESTTPIKLRVATLSEPVARALEQAGHEPLRVVVENGRLPLEDRIADALCVSGLPPAEVAPQVLSECLRVVRDGGRVLVATQAGLARRGPERHEVCALLLHAGLVELEQKMSRGTVISSGRVRRP
jgi:hypothetical protein